MSAVNGWTLEWEGPVLHVAGLSDLYPNDFSTASLRADATSSTPDILAYRLKFSRDKEPFSEKGVGPVHYWEHHVPNGARVVRILTPAGGFIADVVIPGRASAT
jgi:hypothetical protein